VRSPPQGHTSNQAKATAQTRQKGFRALGTRSASALDFRSRWVELGLLIGVVALALVPRLVALDRVATLDETAFWTERTLGFFAALRAGDWAGTLQSGHPGVTTMWLGTLGLLAHDLTSATPFADLDALEQLARLRWPLALLGGLAVVPAYLLLRRLLAPPVALLAALLWASDPFLLAHARVLHLDALLTTFMALSLLALLAALADAANQARSRIAATGPPMVSEGVPPAAAPPPARPGTEVLLALSGGLAGLALLTKGPALLLPPLAALLVLLGALAADRWSPGAAVRRAGGQLAIWLLGAALVWFALWPAAWVDPLRAARAILDEVVLNGGQPHLRGNFFLGQPVDDPGPLFYPLALALRLTPWALVGLLLLPLAWRRAARPERGVILALALSALLFVALLSLSPKKFDRYLLPVFPLLDVLAAAGITAALRGMAATLQPRTLRPHRSVAGIFLGGALGLALATNLWWFHPNHLAYYNPLLGGGPVAQRALLVGWGEGFDEARAWLDAETQGRKAVVASWVERMLKPRAGFAVVPDSELRPGPQPYPQYALLYASQVQREILEDGARYYAEQGTPLHTVRLHGVDYAWIYQVPPPVPTELTAAFGEAIRLRGYGLASEARRGEALRLALYWEGRAAPEADYLLFAHLIGPDGLRYAQADLAPGGDAWPTSRWSAGRFVQAEAALPIPADAPAGQYRLVVGLYDPRDGARLPLRGGPAADPALAGPDALLLATLELQER
jgi:hypothetical protein